MPGVNVQDAETVLNAIDSFGVLQFIEVALVVLLVCVVIGLLWFSRPIMNLFIKTMQRNAETSERLIGVIENNSTAMTGAKQAITSQSTEIVDGFGKLVGELTAGREADTKARDALKEAVVSEIGGHGQTVSKQFDAIKEQLTAISSQLEGVKAVPDLVKLLAGVIDRLDKLEHQVANGAPAATGEVTAVAVVVGPAETKAAGDAPASEG